MYVTDNIWSGLYKFKVMFSIHAYHLLEQIATHIALYCISEGHVKWITKWKIEDKLFYDETGGFTAAL
jgi:hypothetical protein